MIPTKDEQRSKLIEIRSSIFLDENPLANVMIESLMYKYAKWYAEQVIIHCAEVASLTTIDDNEIPEVFNYPHFRSIDNDWTIVDKQSILNVINEL